MSETYGYLGPAGTFTEHAASIYCQKEDQLKPLRTINDVFLNLKEGQINKGVVPLENSVEGSVNISLDLLLKETGFTIIGEIILPIEHHLYAYPRVKSEDIKEIMSHPQAIAQCHDFIREHFPKVEITHTDSTAIAAEYIFNSKDKAMIGSKMIGEIYGLARLADNLTGNLDNHTRFIVIAPETLVVEYKELENYKTSLVFAPDFDRVGVLYEMLHEFASRNINLTKIESRPTKKKMGDYLFYIDLEGHPAEEKVASALKAIRKKSSLYKELGTYPKQKF